MELRHLRYFVAAAEEENVTRAAARLHVSQPPLTRQIHDLEDEIGVPFFIRQRKSIRLTTAGRVFLEECRAVLARANAAVRGLRENDDLFHSFRRRCIAAAEEIHVESILNRYEGWLRSL